MSEQLGDAFEFASRWYSVREIEQCLSGTRTIPRDVLSPEFADWLTQQYRYAMAKGIDLARDEQRTEIDRLQAQLAQLREIDAANSQSLIGEMVKNAELRELLTTACDAWECGQLPRDNRGVVLSIYRAACLPVAWYDAARKACKGVACEQEEESGTASWFAKQPYSSVVIPDQSGGFTSYVREFPGCLSQGETLEEAMSNLRDAAASWIVATKEQGQEIPTPFERAWWRKPEARKECGGDGGGSDDV